MNTQELLSKLVGFPTVSRESNLELIHFARDLLGANGVRCDLVPDETGTKANLFATIGPEDRPGVLLSGHTDVVPVDGQDWSSDPFRLRHEGGRLYGRGTTDMKGFVASALAAAQTASTRTLKTPLHLALSHDEEVGCVGVRSLIDLLAQSSIRPAICIVGEPTSMAVATGHKGKTVLRAVCTGKEAHSALAPKAVNAIHLAADLVSEIRAIQAGLAERGAHDAEYDVPYTTLHVGRISGGTALNIVPNRCGIEFEIRNLPGDDPAAILAELRAAADRICQDARKRAEEAGIAIDVVNDYPGLATAKEAEAVRFVGALTGANGTMKVDFGTEGGLFSERLGVPTIVCGPGSMAQGHKPDEFVTQDQLAACDAMLARLIDRLEAGL